jgi:hypothetical protein
MLETLQDHGGLSLIMFFEKNILFAVARLAEMKSRLHLSRRLSTTERGMELGYFKNPKTINKGMRQ